jgi:signal transduction histidine kinase
LDPFKPLLEEAFHQGKTQGFKEVRIADVHYGVSVSRTLAQGKPSDESSFMLVLADLSTIYQLQGLLLRKERLAALGVMAAGLAHEIRNPMVSIKAFSQLLPAKYDDPVYRRKFEQVVLPQLNRIEDLITALLHAGRAPKPSRMLVDANEIVKDIILLSEPELKNKQCVFDIESRGPLTIYADRSQMTQVFLNLTRNAVQAMKANGHLRVTLRDLNPDWAEIEFKDTGIGMTKLEMDHLFDPFFSTKNDGTGLGLSISYRIIEEHGGKIVLDSMPSFGTTFVVRLPRKPVVTTQIQDRMVILKTTTA